MISEGDKRLMSFIIIIGGIILLFLMYQWEWW